MTAQKILAAAAAAAVSAGLAGCGSSGAVGRVGELKQVARTCPDHERFAAYVSWDVRRTLRGRRVTAVRLESLEKTAEKVAACGGQLRVVAFGSTAASTARLFDGELRPTGATENARLLRVPGLAAHVIDQVESALPGVLAEVSGQGADPLSQFAAAEQFRRQLGTGYALHVVIETSGLMPNVRAALASNTPVPDLQGADVVVAGLGKVGRAAPLPSRAIEALRAFYGRICTRTNADSCLAITDLAPLGG